MATLQERIIAELHVAPAIEEQREIDRRVEFLADYVRRTETEGYILGISGGQDSTLAGRLCQMAVDRLAGNRVHAEFIGVRLPYGRQSDADDVEVAMEFIGPAATMTTDIKPGVDADAQATASGMQVDRLSDFVRGNIKARARMMAQYSVAAERNLLVVGTDHAAEAVTGFFTKYGDGACDVTPLTGLTKSQGAALLRALGAPESTWTKVPTADLEDDRPALPDEQALGVTYRDIDAYLTGESVSAKAVETIEAAYLRTRHKRNPPVSPHDVWWRE